MKIKKISLIIFISLLSVGGVMAQSINFENEPGHDRWQDYIQIDTTNPDNIWVVAQPNKALFNDDLQWRRLCDYDRCRYCLSYK